MDIWWWGYYYRSKGKKRLIERVHEQAQRQGYRGAKLKSMHGPCGPKAGNLEIGSGTEKKVGRC